MAKPVIAIVGAGHMGASHARVVATSPDAELGMVFDSDAVAAQRLAVQYGVQPSSDLDAALHADAVVIATSSPSHFACALPILEAGLPTFVEKPLAPTLEEVDALITAAERTDTPLMCGFVERFNAAFNAAAQQLTRPPMHVLTVRHSPPAPRIASSVVADLLLHDLDSVLRLFHESDPSIAGVACYRPPDAPFTEIADCSLLFTDGMASLSANRMGQHKVRQLTIHSGNQLIEADLLRQNVTVYRNVSQEITRSEGGVGYRSSTEIEIPFVRHVGEPLALQFAHFLALASGQGDHVAERRSVRAPHLLMAAIESTPLAPFSPTADRVAG